MITWILIPHNIKESYQSYIWLSTLCKNEFPQTQESPLPNSLHQKALIHSFGVDIT
jgi:hypothetical protein